jgi:hypothetical protein
MGESPKDQRNYEPQSIEQLVTEFPDWEIYRGVNQMYYARKDIALLRGEDLLDIRDEIIKYRRQAAEF